MQVELGGSHEAERPQADEGGATAPSAVMVTPSVVWLAAGAAVAPVIKTILKTALVVVPVHCDPLVWESMVPALAGRGNARATERSAAAIAHFLGRGPSPEPFLPPTSHLVGGDSVVLGLLPIGVPA